MALHGEHGLGVYCTSGGATQRQQKASTSPNELGKIRCSFHEHGDEAAVS